VVDGDAGAKSAGRMVETDGNAALRIWRISEGEICKHRAGRWDDETWRVLRSYMDRITLWPSTKCGEMAVADDCWPFMCPEDCPEKQHDHPEGRVFGNQVVAGL